MSNHLIILGAGASVSAGAPTMINFIDKARICYASKMAKTPNAFENVFNVIGKLQLAHSKAQLDIINVESIFNAMEMARLAGGFSDYTEENIIQILKDMQTVILETLESSIKFPAKADGHVDAPSDYKKFATVIKEARDNQKHDISIITFNYDICVDHALTIAGLNPRYHLDDFQHEGVPLLKLHGSCNWTTEVGNNNIIPLYMRDYWKMYSWQGMRNSDVNIEISRHMKDYFKQSKSMDVTGDVVVVPPSWNKTSYGNNLKKVWQTARNKLSEADHIHVIGYSFPTTDVYFTLLYAIGTISNKPLLSLNIHNPDGSAEYTNKVKSFLGPGALSRLKFYQTRFDESINVLQNDGFKRIV